MSDQSEYEFFKLRKQAKTYISKGFTFNEQNAERVRQVRMVVEGADEVCETSEFPTLPFQGSPSEPCRRGMVVKNSA